MAERLIIDNVHKKLLALLQVEYKGITSNFPFEQYVTIINEHHSFTSYISVDNRVSQLCAQIVHNYSQDALDRYHRILLLRLLLENQDDMKSGFYTDAIRLQFQGECRRIVQEVEQTPIGFYDYTNDLFCKDVGVATCRMFPAGVLKVESQAGIPRRVLIRNIRKELLAWLGLLWKVGGFKPFYEIHLDVRYRDGFTPEGWDAALRLIGEMLLLYPHIKGITGASWFFDPAIRKISPRLIYLRQSIEDKGGRFFFYKRDDHTTELAISSSPTRRNLYKAGKYHPVSYFMVWPRKEILQWIERI